MIRKSILFRCDANATTGIGHLVRCVLLANKFCSENWQVDFLCSKETKAYRIEWAQSNIRFFYANSCSLSQQSYDIAVIDGYHFSMQDFSHFRHIAKKICIIDDLANRSYSAHLLIDPSFSRIPENYRELANKDCQILAGSAYAIVNPRFLEYNAPAVLKRKHTQQIQNVMVCLGGSEQPFVLQSILSLLRHSDLNFYVCLKSKPSFINDSFLDPSSKIHLLYKEDIARIMLDCDLGLISGGMLTYEVCVLGLPSLVYPLNAHQKFHSNQFAKSGAAIFVCDLNEITSVLLHLTKNMQDWHSMSDKAFSCVDGLGIQRIFKKIDELCYVKQINLS